MIILKSIETHDNVTISGAPSHGCLSTSGGTTTKSASVAPELPAKPQAKLTSYPNPFTDQTTIELAFDEDQDYNC